MLAALLELFEQGALRPKARTAYDIGQGSRRP